MKIILISLFLILYIQCADDACVSLTPESTCTANSACEWSAASCSGDSGTTCSSKTEQAACEGQSYTGTIKCTFTAATAECVDPNDVEDCTSATTETACTALNNDCAWTPIAATCDGNSACEAVKTPTQTSCEAVTYSGTANCKWNAAGCSTKSTSNPTTTPEDSSSFYVKFSYLITFFFLFF
jgi:hypothetical protein